MYSRPPRSRRRRLASIIAWSPVESRKEVLLRSITTRSWAESDRYGAELNDISLRNEGFDVEIALSAAEAEAKFASQEPALSIVELMISGGVGRELCQRLKSRRGTPLLCISSLDLREQALAAGADAFLKKPLEPLQLVSTVRDLLGRGGMMRAQPGGVDD